MKLTREALEPLRPAVTDLTTGFLAPSVLWSWLGVAVADSPVVSSLGWMVEDSDTTAWHFTVLTEDFVIRATATAPWAGWTHDSGQAREDDDTTVEVKASPLSSISGFRVTGVRELNSGGDWSVAAAYVFELADGDDLVVDARDRHPEIRDRKEHLAAALINALRAHG